MPDSVASAASVTAWDLPTRVFHWTLVALIICAWASFEFSEEIGDPRLVWHRWNGLAILTLIVWRILWGFAGPSSVRFRSFVRGPSAALRYARDLYSGTPRHFIGHNPLGGFVILALIGLVGAIGLLGLFTLEENDLATGPLYKYAGEAWAKVWTSWHRFLFEPILIILVAVHVAANVLYGIVKKEPLIPAMITGNKPAADYEDMALSVPISRPVFRAVALLSIAAVVVFGGILGLGGKLP
jgi:cytochrome b